MRNNHTLTFNETTYIINDGTVRNDIYVNGVLTPWYTEYDYNTLGGELPKIKGIRLKNRNDEDTTMFYLYLNTTELQFNHVARIIMTITEESSRNK
jgi:hypothetical protein